MRCTTTSCDEEMGVIRTRKYDGATVRLLRCSRDHRGVTVEEPVEGDWADVRKAAKTKGQ